MSRIRITALALAVLLAAGGQAMAQPESKKFARQLLQASVLYLPLLFALMMINVMRS